MIKTIIRSGAGRAAIALVLLGSIAPAVSAVGTGAAPAVAGVQDYSDPAVLAAALQNATTPDQVNTIVAAASAGQTPAEIGAIVQAAVAAQPAFAASIVSSAVSQFPAAGAAIVRGAVQGLPVGQRGSQTAILVAVAASALGLPVQAFANAVTGIPGVGDTDAVLVAASQVNVAAVLAAVPQSTASITPTQGGGNTNPGQPQQGNPQQQQPNNPLPNFVASALTGSGNNNGTGSGTTAEPQGPRSSSPN